CCHDEPSKPLAPMDFVAPANVSTRSTNNGFSGEMKDRGKTSCDQLEPVAILPRRSGKVTGFPTRLVFVNVQNAIEILPEARPRFVPRPTPDAARSACDPKANQLKSTDAFRATALAPVEAVAGRRGCSAGPDPGTVRPVGRDPVAEAAA